jgi:undecaprenyl-diphosphatase
VGPLRAALLGALHGPAELVPVSSSAHVALVPFLLGCERASTPAARKELEVLLHAGTGVALALVLRREAAAALRALDRRRVALHALALGVPSAVGLLAERPVEERLGTPAANAAGLAAGAVLLLVADARTGGAREAADAGPLDGAVLGLAQAAALAPGVSRLGATLAAARLRGFSRAGASALSWEVALPVLVAATALKGARVLADPPPRAERAALTAGAAAAAASTFAAAPLLRAVERGPWWPYAAERLALAAAVWARSRRRACEDAEDLVFGRGQIAERSGRRPPNHRAANE